MIWPHYCRKFMINEIINSELYVRGQTELLLDIELMGCINGNRHLFYIQYMRPNLITSFLMAQVELLLLLLLYYYCSCNMKKNLVLDFNHSFVFVHFHIDSYAFWHFILNQFVSVEKPGHKYIRITPYWLGNNWQITFNCRIQNTH